MSTSSSESIGLQFHGRSISLPSRLNPNSLTIEAELNKLKTFESSVSQPLNGETIQNGLLGLAELYNSVQELLESPSTQQHLLQYQNGILVEEALERSVEVLDSVGAIRDLFLIIKEQVQILQSSLRRKNGDHSSIESDITSYLSFRKKAKKEISKTLKKLNHLVNKVGSFFVLEPNYYQGLSMVIKVIREVTSITISILKSLLLFLSASPRSTKTNGGWSLISRLMITKSSSAAASPQLGQIVSDVGCVDIALMTLHGNIKSNEAKDNLQMARRKLEILERSSEDLENGLECLFRQLVRNRVTLLNILTH
ncbi:hypothetical protein M9H77_05275 [Catharanthus roseus]|uniref:Uncharacterized protein n=1 Tax=Catharanthus roseus TaxID=4058 RepID=A0ACC0CGS9_CATRO|nr:hypothetical protein M9H77_05275 [Catharanthus roseus]